ncbi:hypothetical protein [Pontibacter sp. G13]|uniref:hypothetical protein n=1 Tax=Pontibacter sp. G13 TaxID=3074898 RepID=UPI00288A0CBA|nr:hypothetical protein [Pontibacter sp. G13]WNJ21311.1 hypothetical protein RJD25_12650 [Pontibacter sp. G13]
MLRLLTNIPPGIHLLLWVVIPLLRFPSFHAELFLPEESLYLLNAQQLGGGAQLYTDAWLAGPPLMVWIYYFFHSLFGSAALTLIRVFTCMYIYLSAVYFTGMIGQYKPFRKHVGLMSLLFVLLVSVPWYGQELSASLFVLLPMCISFHSMLQLGDSRTQNFARMFQVGLWMTVCILATYKSVFILLGVLVAYFSLRSPRLEELASMFGGFVTCLFIVLVPLFFSGSLSDFWDLGVLYYWDRVGISDSLVYQYDVGTTIRAWAMSWGLILFLSTVGFMHFHAKFYSYVASIRAVDVTMVVWLLSVTMMLLFKWKRLGLPDFTLLVPPVVFYASQTFDFRLIRKLRVLLVLGTMAVPLYLYGSYAGIRFPETFSWIQPTEEAKWRHGGTLDALTQADPIYQAIRSVDAPNGVWIMNDQPGMYHSLDKTCANKYTDFRIAYYKFPALPGHSQVSLLSKTEQDRQIFQTFAENPPDLILDPWENFPYLQQRFPSLFSSYQAKTIGKYRVYSKAEIGEGL